MDQVYEVWIEIQANKKLISDSVKFREAMEKCKKAGMTRTRQGLFCTRAVWQIIIQNLTGNLPQILIMPQSVLR